MFTTFLGLAVVTFAAVAPAPKSAPPAVLTDTLYKDKLSKVQRAEAADFLRNQSARLVSSENVVAALARPEVAKLPCLQGRKDAAEYVRKGLKVDIRVKSGQLRVEFNGPCAPSEQAAIVNGVVAAHLAYSRRPGAWLDWHRLAEAATTDALQAKTDETRKTASQRARMLRQRRETVRKGRDLFRVEKSRPRP